MSFLAPIAFWFAATIPVVIVFYLLKRKRVVKLVSSTLLWQKFLADMQANAPFQKLRHNWLLILQLLVLALAILAIARPFFAGRSTTSSLRVIILDASASMQSKDEQPSRFEKAKSEALKLIDSLHEGEEMIVLQADVNTQVKQSATGNKTALARAIESCRVTDSPTRLTEALKLADTLTKQKKDPEIHLFSDGAAGDLSEFENKGLHLVYHRVGQRANNLGVTTLDIRENPENREQRAVYTSVANFSADPKQTDLELLFDNQVVQAIPLSLQPGETVPHVFTVNQSHDGVFTVRINAEDDLAADNQASIVSLMPVPIKILLVTKGNRHIEKALRAAGEVDLTIAQNCTDPSANFDIVVLDDVTPVVWPTPNLVAIHVGSTNWFYEGWSQVEAPAVVDWKNTHPLLRYINFDNVQVAETMAVKTPSWAVSLVDAPQTPLILAGELQHQKIVWIGFDTLQSLWPLRFSFPMFFQNAVEWLNPASTKSSQLMVHAGEPFRFGMSQSAEKTEITFPDGSKRDLNTANTREILFGETTRQGIYHLRAGTNDATFCVNVLDAAESNNQPRDQLDFGKFSKVSATEMKRANIEFWRWLAGVGLAVLLFEWWFYHRRSA